MGHLPAETVSFHSPYQGRYKAGMSEFLLEKNKINWNISVHNVQ